MISKREHDIAVAVAQAHLIYDMNQTDYMDLGAGVSAETFTLYYDAALEQIKDSYPDEDLG